MKKILFAFPIIVLLAAGCNPNPPQQTINNNIPQNIVTQNSNPTPATVPSQLPSANQVSTNTKEANGVNKNSFDWCMANGGKNGTPPNYNAPKVCTLNNNVYTNNCVSNDKYFVISADITNVGDTGILVKYKSTPNQIISCDYIKESRDFEVSGVATYVLALENNFLILDMGTGTDPRGLIIYDLNARKKIYNDSYSRPVNIQNNKVDYWTESATPVTEKNCPDFKQWQADGLGSAIDEHVSLNLLTLKKTSFGEYQCSPRQ